MYELLTTIDNSSKLVASAIGTLFLFIWDCSNSAIEAGHYQGVINLSILTFCIAFLPVGLIFLLPNSKKEQIELKESGEKSFYGGLSLVITLFFSVVGSVVYSIVVFISSS